MIYTAFIGKPDWEAGWPHISFSNEQIRNKILMNLKSGFPGMEFVGREIITKYEPEQMEKIQQGIKSSDGLLLCTIGHYGDPGIIRAGEELLQIGKPAIFANYLYAGDHTFIKTYERIKGNRLRVIPISSSDFDEVTWALGLMDKLGQIQGKRILVLALDKITRDSEGVMQLVSPELKTLPEEQKQYILEMAGKMSSVEEEPYLDLEGVDQAHQWRRDEEKYRQNIKEIFGLELIRKDPKMLSDYYKESDEKQASHIAEGWIKPANVTEPARETIVNAARLYLAIKRLMEELEADAIAPDCGTLLIAGHMPAFPCMGFFQLDNDGSTGICESDLDSGVSKLLGRYLFGRPGFLSNHSLDLTDNRVTYLHCTCAGKLYGPEGKSVEYDIARHAESHFVGASPRVKFPEGEDLTTIKISVLENKIALRTGKIIGQVVDEKGCATKVLVESDARKILDNYDWRTFGWHRVSFVGDWRRELIGAAKLLGLEITEEDR